MRETRVISWYFHFFISDVHILMKSFLEFRIDKLEGKMQDMGSRNELLEGRMNYMMDVIQNLKRIKSLNHHLFEVALDEIKELKEMVHAQHKTIHALKDGSMRAQHMLNLLTSEFFF